jgi:glutaminase
VHGADPKLNDSADPGALSVAAANGHRDVVEILLSAGADVSVVDREGRMPEDHAEREGHGEVAAMLRRARLERGR